MRRRGLKTKMRAAKWILLAVALATQARSAAPLGALEEDWLLQANGKPTPRHVRDEIAGEPEIRAMPDPVGIDVPCPEGALQTYRGRI